MTEKAEVMSKTERGVESTPSEVHNFLQHVMQVNLLAVKQGRKNQKYVPCIWGPAGVAKTSVVKQLERTGVQLSEDEIVYPLVTHIALAQIEESGDLSGLPVTSQDPHGNTVTDYARPVWWPTEEQTQGGKRPVILLIDDFNRADPRILKAIMQLLQDYRSNVHELPDNCHIMLTGNPPSGDDGTEYMVNEIDKAILTRMIHITMKFDKVDWAVWAKREKIDERVINFVLTYPELVDGQKSTRTNPRSVEQFARLIEPITNLRASKDTESFVHTLACSCLDDGVAVAFEKFVFGDMQKLVDPEEILNNWESAEKKLDALKKKGGVDGEAETGDRKKTKLRTDIMGITIDRMYVYLMQDNIKLEEKNYKAFLSFIKRTDLVRQDMMYALLRRLRRDAKTKDQQRLVTDIITYGGREIADLIMQIA
jgi:MoxR-like ATPase